MCLAQGPQRSDAGEARTRSPLVKHSTTEPMCSLQWVKYGNVTEVRPLVKSVYQKFNFLFSHQNKCCGYSKEPCQ